MIKMSTDSVSTDKRLDPIAEDTADLEDGEIESDEETELAKPLQEIVTQSPLRLKPNQNQSDAKFDNKKPFYKDKYRKPGKKHKDKKAKEILEVNTVDVNSVEDDWASNVEKAIANAIRKESDVSESNLAFDNNDKDNQRRKRKRKSTKESRKPAKPERPAEGGSTGEESIDEDELLGIRGGSPVPNAGEPENFSGDCGNNYESYSSDSNDSDGELRNYDERRKHKRMRGSSRRHERKSFKRRGTQGGRQDCHPMQDPDGVCLFYMQGKCQRSEGCPYSHNAEPLRKMELCKFYLMDCCAKKDKCLYLHSDFPCKFYHTGLKCFQKDECKFAHGKPLSNDFKNILLKHIETAPKEILGDFPRLSREGALNMVNAAQQKLIEQQKPQGATKAPIPSLFDLTIPKPKSLEVNKGSTHNKSNKSSSGVRKSRWCDSPQYPIDTSPNMKCNTNSPRNQTPNHNQSYLNIQNLTGLLTSKQISELTALGVVKLDQLNQLTVLQLNELGITMNQINEIQLNALNIQKITSSSLGVTAGFIAEDGKDLDLRIPPATVQLHKDLVSPTSCNKDVDMRYVPLKEMDKKNTLGIEEIKAANVSTEFSRFGKDNTQYSSVDNHRSKEENKAPVIDYSQYLKDSRLNLDRDIKQTSDIDDRQKEDVNEEKENLDKSNLDNDHMMQTDTKLSADNDDKMDPMSGIFRNINSSQLDRLIDSVVEDDEALQIDENSYSSDEQDEDYKINSADESNKTEVKENDSIKEDTPVQSNTALDYLPEKSLTYDYNASTTNTLACKSDNETKSPEITNEDSTSDSIPKFEADVDLRHTADMDMRLTNFGDTDLRQVRVDTDLRRVPRDTDLRDKPTNKDVDLRMVSTLDLPFKPVVNYTPASEIDGSITSHPPIVYKVFEIEVPAPDYSAILKSTSQTQAAIDPRLRKIFKMNDATSAEETPAQAAVPSEPAEKKPRVDPRKRKECVIEIPKPTTNTQSVLDIQVVLQTSEWYKELSTNQKIMVNQQLASVSTLLKQFNQDKSPDKVFDLSLVRSNHILCSILQNLGIYLTETGQFAYIKDAMDMTGGMDSMLGLGTSAMGVMGSGMNQMGLMPNMMNSGNFDSRFQTGDPRAGLLGIAPNMPFEGYNPNGQYNNDNYGNYMNFGFSNERPCDEENYHYRNNNRRGNRNQGGGGSGNINNHSNPEHWTNRPDRGNGPRRNFSERGRGGSHRPRDRGGGPRKDKSNRK